MAVQPGFKLHRFFRVEAREAPPAPSHITASAGGGGATWLGCADGTVQCLAGDLSLQAAFQAHHGPVHALAWCKGKLLTVGADGEGLKGLFIKGWAVEGLRPGATPAVLASPARLLPGGPASKASSAAGSGGGGAGDAALTAVALHCGEWPTAAVALGLSSGAVHMLRADVAKSKVTAPVPAAHLHGAGGGSSSSASTSGITALHFAQAAAAAGSSSAGGQPAAVAAAAGGGGGGGGGGGASSGDLHLFAVGASRLAAFDARSGRRLLEDECGAAPGCSAVSDRGELLLAGPDAVYSYTAEEGRKAAFAVRGDKLALAAVRHYVVAVLADDAAGGGGGALSPGAQAAAGAVAQVFDLRNKVVAASAPVEPPVRWIATAAAGCIDIGDATGAVTRLAEKPFSERLAALYKTRSYQLAVAVAEAEQVDAASLAGIRRAYGDFLYAKRDYEGAMEQYAATVGHLEPSYVIQRFLDVQRVAALTQYLERLHAKGAASSDHTTLLLNCYTKLKDSAKLDAFIQGDGGMTRDSLHFDVDTAIKVCRAAGYYEHALFVAAAAGEPGAYLDVLLEDCQRYGEGLEYIRGLPRAQAAAALQKYGKALLGAVPVEATAALMQLCLPDPADPSAFVASMADFTHLYTDRPEDLRYACVTILNMSPGGPSPGRQALYHTLLDLYLSGTGEQPATGGGSASASGQAGAEPAAAAAAAAGAAQRGTAPAAGSSSSSQQEALDLLKRGWPPGGEPAYDVDHALVACRLHAFRPGLLFLYENLRLYRQVAAVLMDARDHEALLAACQRFGDARTGGDPQLWHDALEYFARQPEDCSQQVQELLGRIEAGGILPPLVVLQVLSRNPHFRLSLVKDYVARQLQADSRSIRADAEEAARLRAAVDEARAGVERLQAEPVVFQSSRDSQTNAPLELPSVHFLCGHSYNLRTLGDGDAACPLCAGEQRKAQELRRSNRASAADKDAFFKQLRSAPDGFGVVAEYFGKGLLNHTSVSTGTS